MPSLTPRTTAASAVAVSDDGAPFISDGVIFVLLVAIVLGSFWALLAFAGCR